MSSRAHFWFRLLAVAAIVLAQFGPRLWNGATTSSTGRVVAASVP